MTVATQVGRVLHVGCGTRPLPDWFNAGEEVRLDIDPECQPDIIASMTHLGEIGKFDMVFSNHCLEHLFPVEVAQALREFRRVLEPEGYACIIVPDIEGVEPTNEVLFHSESGLPISGLDLIYGHQIFARESPYMVHHCGFTRHTLYQALDQAGFRRSRVDRMSIRNLFGVGVK